MACEQKFLKEGPSIFDSIVGPTKGEMIRQDLITIQIHMRMKTNFTGPNHHCTLYNHSKSEPSLSCIFILGQPVLYIYFGLGFIHFTPQILPYKQFCLMYLLVQFCFGVLKLSDFSFYRYNINIICQLSNCQHKFQTKYGNIAMF